MKAPMIPRELIDYPEPQELEAEYAATSAALERAYLAILNMEAHGTPIPMYVLAEAESWIGEQALMAAARSTDDGV